MAPDSTARAAATAVDGAPASQAQAPRIGLAFLGDGRLPSAASGAPLGLAQGLGQAGAEVRHLNAAPAKAIDRFAAAVLTTQALPRAARDGGAIATLRSARSIASTDPRLARLWCASLRRSVEAAGHLDAIVQVGSGYAISTTIPFATRDDMTVLQASRHGFAQWSRVSPRTVQLRYEQQREVYRRAAVCCVASTWTARSLVEEYDVPSEKVRVIGVGRNRSPLGGDRDWSRPRFLFVGKDWKRKNGDAVVRAFARLRRQVPSATLDLVGGHPWIAEPGVRGHGFLRLDQPSERERLDQIFRRSTCFVMPSWLEPFGIAFSEAASAGIPSIGTSIGGCADLVGECGRVVDPADDRALFEAMRELSEPATARRLGEVAAARSQQFTWRAVGERLLRALGVAGTGGTRLAADLA